ncbi:MAG: Sec-dependent nitrous-oxide reductase [Isosphaeraceae bacterium]
MNVRGWRGAKATAAASLALLVSAGLTGCDGGSRAGGSGAAGNKSITGLMEARKLSEADVVAALKTYTPTGVKDEFLMFASGGHGGNVIVIGLPSMRILKYIGVFTPEPWQGYGFDDETRALLKEASPKGAEPLTWGDMHHPALSETKGDYDGQFLFVNDKANARVAVISLKDFTTQQIVHSPILKSNHGGTFVTPNTDYVIEGGQFPMPLDGRYEPIEKYNDTYRGAVVFWKFDRDKGKVDPARSFAIELPPYCQDLSDAGKLASDGWVFINTFNTERSVGSGGQGKPSMESGASQNDMDYLHIIDWKKAEKLAASEKVQTIQGFRVIPMAAAIEEGILHFVPEPKSPHGVDVTPDGKAICVSGKLSTQETVYDFAKLRQLMDQKTYAGKDPYGVPILPFKEAIRGQVEMGLGPLHTQFDNRGSAYTTLFIESKIARWSLKDLKVIEKIPVHYNVGHLAVAGGDTVHPDGRYLVSMNKWAIDRFADVGPLLPQNFQLIDIAGDAMQLLYDMPLPLGEPHYAQIIKTDLVKPWEAYTPVGMNQLTHEHDPNAIDSAEKARIERHGNTVDVYMTLVRSTITPDTIKVKQGDTVKLHITNLEQTRDATHGFCVAEHNVNLSMEPGKASNVTFKAVRPGVFPFYCTEFCSALHLEMAGYLLVEPTGNIASAPGATDKQLAAAGRD